MDRMTLCSEGLAYAWVRIQLRHAASARQFLTVFTSSGLFFKLTTGLNTSPSLLTRWMLVQCSTQPSLFIRE
jgi:hypothetical protein